MLEWTYNSNRDELTSYIKDHVTRWLGLAPIMPVPLFSEGVKYLGELYVQKMKTKPIQELKSEWMLIYGQIRNTNWVQLDHSQWVSDLVVHITPLEFKTLKKESCMLHSVFSSFSDKITDPPIQKVTKSQNSYYIDDPNKNNEIIKMYECYLKDNYNKEFQVN